MRTLALAVVLVGGVVACGGGEEVNFVVSSAGGSFDAGVTGVDESGSNTSVWVNTSTQAEISMSLGVGTTGQIKVTIKDDGGTQMFQGTISDGTQTSLDAITTAGTAGTWEVRIEASSLNGSASVSLSPI